MPIITVHGKEKNYIFSVVPYDYGDMPDWGGVYIAVNASENGLRMESCVALGGCSSFKKYQNKILKFIKNKCTHVYLMPEYEVKGRAFAMADLISAPAFAEVPRQVLEHAQIPDDISWYDDDIIHTLAASSSTQAPFPTSSHPGLDKPGEVK